MHDILEIPKIRLALQYVFNKTSFYKTKVGAFRVSCYPLNFRFCALLTSKWPNVDKCQVLVKRLLSLLDLKTMCEEGPIPFSPFPTARHGVCFNSAPGAGTQKAASDGTRTAASAQSPLTSAPCDSPSTQLDVASPQK